MTLRDVKIHGFANAGIKAARLHDWTLQRVRIIANGWAGWDGDLGSNTSSNSGEIRYKTALALGGTPLTEPLFDGILSPNLMAMQRYLPALRDVAAGRLSPVEAVALVEGGASLPG